MNGFDSTLFHALNQHAGHTPGLDSIMKVIAQYSLEMYAVLFVIAWFALPRREEQKRHGLIVALFGGVIALIINAVIGAIWYRPRPFVTLHSNIIPHPQDASFPSDHAAGAFGFTSGAWGRTAAWFYWVSLILGILVMVARVYVGVHWPTDVLGGLVVGLLSGRLARLFSRPLRVVTNIGLRLFKMGHFSR